MPDRRTQESSRVFISYRRQDAGHFAGRLYDRLAGRFGESNVFMDIDSIGPGLNFAESIDKAMRGSQVVLVLIGSSWLSAVDENKHRRLDNPEDFVRREIETALAQDRPIIPILVDHVEMPSEQDMPDAVSRLPSFQALRMERDSFNHDFEQLLKAILVLTKPPPRKRKPKAPKAYQAIAGSNRWRAEPLERKESSIKLRITLSHRSHLLEYAVKTGLLGFGKTVSDLRVDGEQPLDLDISSDSNFGNTYFRLDFNIVDGGIELPYIIKTRVSSGRIRIFDLTVAERKLFTHRY
jgi:TIR domain